jgi:uncharacterized damage-inducible protein DinB
MTLLPSSGFPYYISLVGENDFLALLKSDANHKFFASINEEQSRHRYAPDKWTLKQVLGHITDHERIMSYRALRFSRKDPTILPGYDQDLFVENGRFDQRTWAELVNDHKNVRQATLSLIGSLSEEQYLYKGLAWKYELPVSDVLKATVGHEIHHVKIIRERYLKS